MTTPMDRTDAGIAQSLGAPFDTAFEDMDALERKLKSQNLSPVDITDMPLRFEMLRDSWEAGIAQYKVTSAHLDDKWRMLADIRGVTGSEKEDADTNTTTKSGSEMMSCVCSKKDNYGLSKRALMIQSLIIHHQNEIISEIESLNAKVVDYRTVVLGVMHPRLMELRTMFAEKMKEVDGISE